mmetsp:Transcript_34637/g.96704  ORF Transcript_34637/g.96704 Transcript_34637/m.96704 type:complete len:201 (+) Transcript_34637:66-668(+)
MSQRQEGRGRGHEVQEAEAVAALRLIGIIIGHADLPELGDAAHRPRGLHRVPRHRSWGGPGRPLPQDGDADGVRGLGCEGRVGQRHAQPQLVRGPVRPRREEVLDDEAGICVGPPALPRHADEAAELGREHREHPPAGDFGERPRLGAEPGVPCGGGMQHVQRLARRVHDQARPLVLQRLAAAPLLNGVGGPLRRAHDAD